MFIWDLVSITAGVSVLIILLILGYAIIDGLIRGFKKAVSKTGR